MKVTWLVASQVPICLPSGEHTDWPDEVQPPADELASGDAGAGAAGATGAVLATGAVGAVGTTGVAGAGAAPESALPLGAPEAAAGGAAPDPPDAVAAETPAPQLPVGGPFGFSPKCWTVGPGFGKSRSTPSTVRQPLAMLATNMSGNESARFENPGIFALRFEPPVTVIGAQFMYISRFPRKLNHVHARV